MPVKRLYVQAFSVVIKSFKSGKEDKKKGVSTDTPFFYTYVARMNLLYQNLLSFSGDINLTRLEFRCLRSIQIIELCRFGSSCS